jgi:hypothetical protein
MARNMGESRLGVALTKCYFCGEGNEIIMNSILSEQHAANVDKLDRKVISMRPCSKCEGYMKLGILFITVDESKCEPEWNVPPSKRSVAHRRYGEDERWMPSPWRTGGFFVVKEEAVRRFITDDMLDYVLKNRWMFMDDKAARELGFFDQPEKTQLDQNNAEGEVPPGDGQG